MINFIIFLVSYIVNPLIIYLIKNEDAKLFLQTFTYSNIFFSLFVTIFFSNILKIKKPHSWLLMTSAVTILSVIIIYNSNQSTIALAIIYPFSILITDYIITQSQSQEIVRIYRLFILMSALLVVLFIDNIYYYLACRSAIIMFVGILLLLKKRTLKNLKIKSPLNFIVLTYAAYSGALLFLTYNIKLNSEALKYWYITFQVGLGIMLKLLDYSSRGGVILDKKIIFLCMSISAALILATSIFYFNVLNVFIGLVSVLILSKLIFETRIKQP